MRPRLLHVPRAASTAAADEAIALGRLAGIALDPWQEDDLRVMLGERPDGRWAAPEFGHIVPRQNGKTALIEVRELAGLFVFGEEVIVHSAHEVPTALESMRNLTAAIRRTPQLQARVKNIYTANGKESIELWPTAVCPNGQRLIYKARTRGGGRGFGGDLIVIDEGYDYPEEIDAAIRPLMSARPNPQIVFASSAIDKERHPNGRVLSKLRSLAIAGEDGIGFVERAAHVKDIDEACLPVVAGDPERWAQANPAMGSRIDVETIAREQRSMDPRSFAVERLGVGEYHDDKADASSVIDPDAWATFGDPRSQPLDPVSLAYDVTTTRGSAAISVSGVRDDGRMHCEVIDHRPGTAWLVERLVEVCKRHGIAEVACDAKSQAAAFASSLEARGIKVEKYSAQDHANACGALLTAVKDDTFRHRDQHELNTALRGAAKRDLGDLGWAWGRKDSTVDITPVVSMTIAHHRAQTASEVEFDSDDYTDFELIQL